MFTPEQQNMIRDIIRKELSNIFRSDRYLFDMNLEFTNGTDIQLGFGRGTQIGTKGGATGQKLGFFGNVPVTQRIGVGATAAAIQQALIDLGLITA